MANIKLILELAKKLGGANPAAKPHSPVTSSPIIPEDLFSSGELHQPSNYLRRLTDEVNSFHPRTQSIPINEQEVDDLLMSLQMGDMFNGANRPAVPKGKPDIIEFLLQDIATSRKQATQRGIGAANEGRTLGVAPRIE